MISTVGGVGRRKKKRGDLGQFDVDLMLEMGDNRTNKADGGGLLNLSVSGRKAWIAGPA